MLSKIQSKIQSKDFFGIFKYFTNWSFVLFLIWYFYEKSRKYIYPELVVTVIFYGYIAIFIFYHLLYKKKEYNLYFLLFNILFHYIPFKLVTEKSIVSERSILFFFVLFIVYFIFLRFHSKTPFDVYFNDKEKNKL